MGEERIMNENLLNIYLGQKEHYITLDEMENIILRINNIGNSLAEHIFNNSPKDLFIIYPQKKGSFEIIVGIIGISSMAVNWLSETDSGKAFIKGLTGHETPYYWKKGGELLRDLINGILQKNIKDLKKVNDENNFILDKSIKEKSELFNTLHKSKTIKSISFDKYHEKQIEKTNFYQHIIKGDIVRLLEPRYEIQDLIISKSINTRSKGKWTFKSKINNHGQIDAKILDDTFLSDFLNGYYPLKEKGEDDIVRVLLQINTTIKNGNKEKEEYFIQEIFSFNHKKIKDIPKDLEKYLMIKYNYNEPTLFDT